MKRIFSAGGIVLRPRSGSSIGGKGDLEVLVTQHSGHKGWDFPKGHIELGESAEVAALREVEEETGVKGEIIEKVGETKYFFYEKKESSSVKTSDDKKVLESKQKVFKTVIYYLMKYISDGKATTAWEVSGKKWLKPEEVEAQLTFEDTKALWRDVKSKAMSLKLKD